MLLIFTEAERPPYFKFRSIVDLLT